MRCLSQLSNHKDVSELEKYKYDKKGLKRIKDLIKADEESMLRGANDILEKQKQFEKFKWYQGNLTYHIAEDDVKFQYFSQVQKSINLCLPILNKVVGSTLALACYNMSLGHCEAVGNALKIDKTIRRLFLKDCGLRDEEFSVILESCSQMQDFKSLIYHTNSLDQKCIKKIAPLLIKKLPLHLDELRLINLNVTGKISQEFV